MAPPVTGTEIPITPDMLLVSKTDVRGVITYANTTFSSVCGYRVDELLGRPHAIVRHPWMPRCIFSVMWRTLKEGREIFAYVVNRAKSGDHYWVLAHVTPDRCPDTGTIRGYHSARRRAPRRAIDAMTDLYARLREAEAAVPKNRQCAVGEACLQQILDEHGTTLEALTFDLARPEAA